MSLVELLVHIGHQAQVGRVVLAKHHRRVLVSLRGQLPALVELHRVDDAQKLVKVATAARWVHQDHPNRATRIDEKHPSHFAY
jgi:hypothetical protein